VGVCWGFDEGAYPNYRLFALHSGWTAHCPLSAKEKKVIPFFKVLGFMAAIIGGAFLLAPWVVYFGGKVICYWDWCIEKQKVMDKK
jgi:hypothetical protein